MTHVHINTHVTHAKHGLRACEQQLKTGLPAVSHSTRCLYFLCNSAPVWIWFKPMFVCCSMCVFLAAKVVEEGKRGAVHKQRLVMCFSVIDAPWHSSDVIDRQRFLFWFR